MSKKQFTLDSWLKDKSQKVVTRCGFPVRIVCTDVKRKDYPILALVERDDQEEYQSFTKDGRFSLYNPLHDNFDLFIETNEVSEDEIVIRALKSHLTYMEEKEGWKGVAGIKMDRILDWLEKQGEQIDIANKEYWRGYREGKKLILDKYAEVRKQSEQKFEMKTAEESLGIDSDTYNKIVDECIFGEQKPADKVEPKFKVGEWITNGDYTWKIVGVKPLDYILQSQDGNIVDDTISHVDEQFHSFTIQDTKDGDVLYINNTVSESIMIYKSFNNGVINKYASYNKFGFEGEHYLTLNDGYITPATKEQRDTLMKAMVDAGYTFDFEKKELKKIVQEPEENKGNVGGISPNSAWSEEDEQHVNSLLKRLQGMCKKGATYTATRFPVSQDIDWLKSLKERKGGKI